MNNPGMRKNGGIQRNVNATVASTEPVSLANVAKAPARMNIQIIYRILELPAAFEISSMRCDNVPPGCTIMPHIIAEVIATDIGMR